jgi:hypothetical protein
MRSLADASVITEASMLGILAQPAPGSSSATDWDLVGGIFIFISQILQKKDKAIPNARTLR